MYVKSNRERIIGTEGRDNLEGGSGRNEIFGGDKDDTVFGGVDDVRDHLDGGGFPQVYRSQPDLGTWGHGSGNDVLEMGQDDFGYGRDGADLFRFHTAGQPYRQPGWVQDFDLREGDRISLAHGDGVTIRDVKYEIVGDAVHLIKLGLVGHDQGILDGMRVVLRTDANDGWGDDFRWTVPLDPGEGAMHAIREMVREASDGGADDWIL